MDDTPWDELPHDDYGPGLLATVWTLIGIAGAFIGLRIYCKFSRGRGLWLDDHVLVASWVRLPQLRLMTNLPVPNNASISALC